MKKDEFTGFLLASTPAVLSRAGHARPARLHLGALAQPCCQPLALDCATTPVVPCPWRAVLSGALLACANLLAAPLQELAEPTRCSRASLLDCTAVGALLTRAALLAALARALTASLPHACWERLTCIRQQGVNNPARSLQRGDQACR